MKINTKCLVIRSVFKEGQMSRPTYLKRALSALSLAMLFTFALSLPAFAAQVRESERVTVEGSAATVPFFTVDGVDAYCFQRLITTTAPTDGTEFDNLGSDKSTYVLQASYSGSQPAPADELYAGVRKALYIGYPNGGLDGEIGTYIKEMLGITDETRVRNLLILGTQLAIWH